MKDEREPGELIRWPKRLMRRFLPGVQLRLEWKPQDLWVGAFWKGDFVATHVWICLLPCLPIHVVILSSHMRAVLKRRWHERRIKAKE